MRLLIEWSALMSYYVANFEFHIAWRYLFSKKGHNAINIVSGLSAMAIVVVTAAMICVLSGMNGLGATAQQMFSAFDPPLLIVPAQGQTLRTDTTPIASLYAREDIQAVSVQLEQTTIVRFQDNMATPKQIPAHILGVDSLFPLTAKMDTVIYEGRFCVWDGAHERAVLGCDIAEQLHINAFRLSALHLYAPTRTKRINMARPDKSLKEEKAYIAGIFSGDQTGEINQTIITSLELAQRLYEYDDHTGTSVRIMPQKGVSVTNLKKQLSKSLGPGYKVLDRYDQQADYFRIFRLEKWLTILLLSFIILIASINIIGSLSMLMIDKRDDSCTLSCLGADTYMIRRIFMIEGWLISGIGTFLGIAVGVLLCLGQQHFGWIELGDGSNYIISSYPVEVQWLDVVMVAFIVLSIGLLAAWYTSRHYKISKDYE